MLNSMFNYFSQLITQTYITTGSIQAALATINPTSILLGLGMAAAGFAVNALSNTLFPNRSEPSKYADIDPSKASSEASRKRMGSIAAAPVQYINIIPTVSIDGQYIWIGSGSVEELETGLEELILRTTQQAIDTNSLDLAGVSPR